MFRPPCLVKAVAPDGGLRVHLGHPLLDEYLGFLAARARPNTLLATAFDLKVFFAWAAKEPADIRQADVIDFVAAQRAPRGDGKLVRISDGGAGLSARTVARRLSSLSGLFAYLVARGDAGVLANPVPRGLATRRARRNGGRPAPLVRTPRTLPRILEPGEVDRLMAVLRSARDRAMVDAMVLGGLRRCEVLGLRMADLHPGEHRVFVAAGKGGHQRVVPMSTRFFSSVATYLAAERPADADTEAVFVVMKGPRRGRPLSSDGLDEILDGARERAGLVHGTCHQLRHTCLTRLREAGMAPRDRKYRVNQARPLDRITRIMPDVATRARAPLRRIARSDSRSPVLRRPPGTRAPDRRPAEPPLRHVLMDRRSAARRRGGVTPGR